MQLNVQHVARWNDQWPVKPPLDQLIAGKGVENLSCLADLSPAVAEASDAIR
jgi:hypothetical protein